MSVIKLTNKLDIYNLIKEQLTKNPPSNPQNLSDQNMIIVALNDKNKLIVIAKVDLDSLLHVPEEPSLLEYYDKDVIHNSTIDSNIYMYQEHIKEIVEPHNASQFIIITFSSRKDDVDVIYVHDQMVDMFLFDGFTVPYEGIDYPLDTILKS